MAACGSSCGPMVLNCANGPASPTVFGVSFFGDSFDSLSPATKEVKRPSSVLHKVSRVGLCGILRDTHEPPSAFDGEPETLSSKDLVCLRRVG